MDPRTLDWASSCAVFHFLFFFLSGFFFASDRRRASTFLIACASGKRDLNQGVYAGQ